MQFGQLNTRREFIMVLGGAASAWPLIARAQQGEQVRRIGVLANVAEDDQEERRRLAAFLQSLRKLGWRDGDNVRLDHRHTLGQLESARRFAAELIALAPDVILATGSTAARAVLDATRTVPIVFVGVTDPAGAGFVASFARPGGNATGFMNFDYALSGKWIELLKDIAPRVARVAVLRDLTIAAGDAQFGVIQGAAASLRVEVSPIGMRDAGEIEHGITAFARGADGGLIVTGSPPAIVHRDLIITLADRHKLPAVYPLRTFIPDGGLISYGPDQVEMFGQAAGYVDRILKGAKPADLPVQGPTKYELVINLKTAKMLGLTMPPSLLARADEVIE
jgi:putative ABC transport system substrate-binding protein